MPINVKGSDSLYFRSGIDLTGMRTGVTQAKGLIAGFAKSISGMDVFAGIGISAVYAFGKVEKIATDFSREFEQKMTEVKTISRAVQEDYEGMSKALLDMGRGVPDDISNMVDGLYQIVSAGYDGAEALDVLRQSAQLAVGGVTDTKTAADAITYVMNAFGEAAGNAERIADRLFTTVRLGKTKLEELGPAVSMVAGLWAQAGGSFDDLMATFAEGVKKLPTNIMATGIRGIIAAIVSPTKDAKEIIKEFGIDMSATALRSKGFLAMLKDIHDKTHGNIEVLSQLFPNVRGLVGLLSVATKGGKEYAKSLDAIKSSAGASAAAFETMAQTADNQAQMLKNNILRRLKPLGDFFVNLTNNIVKGLNYRLSQTGDYFTDMSRHYEGVLRTMKAQRSDMQELISTIDELSKKTNLTKEETIELQGAQEALGIYMPEFAQAMADGVDAVEALTIATRGLKDADLEILEMQREVKLGQIEQTQGRLEEIRVGKSAAEQQVKNAKKERAEVEKTMRTLAMLLELRYKAQKLEEETGKREYYADRIPREQRIKDTLRKLGLPQIFPEAVEKKFLATGMKQGDIFNYLTQQVEGYQDATRGVAKATNELSLEEKKLNLELAQHKKALEVIEATIARGGKKPTVKTPRAEPEGKAPDWETLKARREFFAEWLAEHMTKEEKIAAIRKKYIELDLADQEDKYKKRLEMAEQADIDEVELEEIKLEDKKRIADLEAEINDEKNKDRLTGLSQTISKEMDIEGRSVEYYKSLKRLQQQVNRESMTNMIRDVRRMSRKELTEYKDFLEKKLDAYKDNADMQVWIMNRLQKLEEETHNRLLRDIQNMGKAIEVYGEFMKSIGAAADEDLEHINDLMTSIEGAIRSYQSGDMFGMIVNIGSLIQKIAAEWLDDSDDIARQIEVIKGAMTGLFEVMEDWTRRQVGEEYIRGLGHQIKYLTMMIRKNLDELDLTGWLDRLDKGTVDSLTELYDLLRVQAQSAEGEDLARIEVTMGAIRKLMDVQEELRHALTQTTAEDIADAIIEGLRQGKDAIKDFASTFEEMMTNALIESFRRSMISKYFQDFYDTFAMFAEGGLTEDELKALRWAWDYIMGKISDSWSEFEKFAESVGLDVGLDSSKTGLAGAIKGVTEDTASLLAGQFMAIRMNTVAMLSDIKIMNERTYTIMNYTIGATQYLQQIEKNTSYNRHIPEIVNELKRSRLSGRGAMRSIGV